MNESIFLLLSGFTAGIINSVAGGGALIIFPLLISLGLSPKIANGTTSVGVFGGQITSAIGYKKYLKKIDNRFGMLLAISFIGGGIGALVLQKTSDELFGSIAPWFVLLAVFLLIMQPVLKKLIPLRESAKTSEFILLCFITIIVALYGGFFGAGMGIVIFAIISLAGLTNVNQINGMKNLVTIMVNGAANIYFIFSGLISWEQAGVILIGSTLGGYIGAKSASRLPAVAIRVFVIACGIIATVVLFRE